MDCYNAYKEAVGGITYNGEQMKQFSEMPERIQKAWQAVEIAMEEKYDPHYGKSPLSHICLELPEKLKAIFYTEE